VHGDPRRGDRPAQRFNVHGLKHRGIADTDGGKVTKKEASDHKTDAMTALHDHEIPVVDPVRRRGK